MAPTSDRIPKNASGFTALENITCNQAHTGWTFSKITPSFYGISQVEKRMSGISLTTMISHCMHMLQPHLSVAKSVTRPASSLPTPSTSTTQPEPNLRDTVSRVPDHQGGEDDEEETDEDSDAPGFVEDEDEYDDDAAVDDSDDEDYGSEPVESDDDDD